MFPARKSGGGRLTFYDAMCLMVTSNFAKRGEAKPKIFLNYMLYLKFEHFPKSFYKAWDLLPLKIRRMRL